VIVIGEYERGYGGRYASMTPLFEHYGIQRGPCPSAQTGAESAPQRQV
jgi:hypothetical protein